MALVADDNTYLCIDCVEKRIGRRLTKEDFQNISYNFNPVWKEFKSPELLNRLDMMDMLDIKP